MLSELHIKNLAIIDQQTIHFGPGLNVISGETGSGKSIILNAIEFLLGSKPKPQSLRTGEDELDVQAIFKVGDAIDRLPDIARQDEVCLARSLNSSGKSKVFINGRLSTVSLLSEVSSALVNICGQNQHIRLLNPSFHLDLVDEYGGLTELRARYCLAFASWMQADDELKAFRTRVQQNALRQAELEFIVDELGKAEIKAGLRKELEDKVKELGRGESALSGLQRLQEGILAEGGLMSSVREVSLGLSELCKLDPGIVEIAEHFRSSKLELEAFEAALRQYARKIQINPELLGELRERLADIARLERKYRLSDAELVSLFERSKQELSELSGSSDIRLLEARAQEAYCACSSLASELTLGRQKSGRKLAKEVQGELSELNLGKARLELNTESVELGPLGQDKGELYLAANQGEAPRPLRQIASGGELSRIMLVLKKLLRDKSGVNILVFDEIDTGISGGVARAVGQKLLSLAKHSQVICITHLPQVASLADHHFLVDKTSDKRTTSTVRELSGPQRVEEIARMLAGYKITAASRESARELLSSKS